MNKSQLVDALAERLGDRRTAANAVDSLLQIVVDTVGSGESVSLAGFGVFESRSRAARTGRNPRTGEAVAVPATTVPAFRPGTGFRNAVAGDAPAAPVPEVAPAPARRRRAVAKTNGAGDGAALNGAVDLASVPTTTLLAEQPVPGEAVADEAAAQPPTPAAKASKKPAGKSKKAAAPAKGAPAKGDAKKGKKGKKGK